MSSTSVTSSAETVWEGYARTRLPAAETADDLDLHVPGDLVTGAGDGWVGFATSEEPRDAAETREDVEVMVDQLLELETSMDG